jgi:hypothetical protein
VLPLDRPVLCAPVPAHGPAYHGGMRAWVTAWPDAPVDVGLAGRVVAHIMTEGRVPPDRVDATSLGLQRAWGAGAASREVLFPSPERGAVLVEWSPAPAAIVLALPGARVRRSADGTVLCAVGDAAFRVAASGSIEEGDSGADGARLRVRRAERARLRVLFAQADEAQALRDPASLVRARAGAFGRLARDRIDLDAPGLPDGLAAWCALMASTGADRSGLVTEPPAAPGRPPRSSAAGRVAAGLGGLAIGDPMPADIALDAFLQDGSGAPDELVALHLHLLGRLFAWTGDLRSLLARWTAVLPYVRRLADLLADVGSYAPVLARVRARAALRALVATAEAVGDARLAARLSTAAGPAPPGAVAPAGPALVHAVALGVADPDAAASVVRGIAPAGGAPERATLATARFLCAGPDEGLRLITADLRMHPLAAALLAEPLVTGMLGAVPDAARGRLRLAPRLPSGWDRLDVRGLRIGDATIELAVRRDDRTVRYTVDQASGTVPLRLILEPALDRPISAARVDGRPADLAIRPVAGRVVAPVQLVLDHTRSLELDLIEPAVSRPPPPSA